MQFHGLDALSAVRQRSDYKEQQKRRVEAAEESLSLVAASYQPVVTDPVCEPAGLHVQRIFGRKCKRPKVFYGGGLRSETEDEPAGQEEPGDIGESPSGPSSSSPGGGDSFALDNDEIQDVEPGATPTAPRPEDFLHQAIEGQKNYISWGYRHIRAVQAIKAAFDAGEPSNWKKYLPPPPPQPPYNPNGNPYKVVDQQGSYVPGPVIKQVDESKKSGEDGYVDSKPGIGYTASAGTKKSAAFYYELGRARANGKPVFNGQWLNK